MLTGFELYPRWVPLIIHRCSEYINRTGTVHGQEVHAAPVKFSPAPAKNLTSILAFKFLNGKAS